VKSKRSWSDKKLSWTDRQREIADLVGQGKTYQQIIDLGYSKHMTSRVINALRKGIKPPEVELNGANEGGGNGGGTGQEDGVKSDKTKPFVQAVGPKTAPIVFSVEQKKIPLDPIELHRQYSYYLDIANKDGGIINSFSQVQTVAMQVLWVLLQNIPKDENMLRAIFYGIK
jgi:hypothetical protein